MAQTGLPPFFKPMLATLVREPFDSDSHLFELKWDGVRTLAFCEKGSTRLFSRTGREVNHQYPEFGDLHSRLQVTDAVLDGEIVALNNQGRPSFELLQKRINLARERDVRRGMEKVSLDLVIFDLVVAEGDWLGGLALSDRLERLSESFAFGERVIKSQAVSQEGVAMFRAAQAQRLEGIVAKDIRSHYIPGKRTRDWLKIKIVKSIDCVIGGWSPGLGGRGSSLGALLLGLYEGNELRHVGSVGTGFTESTLGSVRRRLEEHETPTSPFSEKIPVKGARWVKPEMVCEVEFREVTNAPKLRAPSFKGLRDDKAPQECQLAELEQLR